MQLNACPAWQADEAENEMLASTRISLTYKFLACAIFILTCALAYAIWSLVGRKSGKAKAESG